MNTYPVKFKVEADPSHKGGYILRYVHIADLVPNESPLKVVFEDGVKLEGAFLRAGLYLRSSPGENPGQEPMPDPEQNYEVNDQMMRAIGFNFPS